MWHRQPKTGREKATTVFTTKTVVSARPVTGNVDPTAAGTSAKRLNNNIITKRLNDSTSDRFHCQFALNVVIAVKPPDRRGTPGDLHVLRFSITLPTPDKYSPYTFPAARTWLFPDRELCVVAMRTPPECKRPVFYYFWGR